MQYYLCIHNIFKHNIFLLLYFCEFLITFLFLNCFNYLIYRVMIPLNCTVFQLTKVLKNIHEFFKVKKHYFVLKKST